MKAFAPILLAIILVTSTIGAIPATAASPERGKLELPSFPGMITIKPGAPQLAWRRAHASTLLPDGTVLVNGGADWDGAVLGTAEVFDPVKNAWSATGSMETARVAHTATLLPTGKVLVTGGATDVYEMPPMRSAELYDPATRTWTSAGSMSIPRFMHAATLLHSGEVLVTGGQPSEIFDAAENTWSVVNSPTRSRYGHTATLLPSGEVVVLLGGGEGSTTVETFDPISKTWSDTGTIASIRAYHSATLLPSGKILITGGLYGTALADALVYDPQSGTTEVVAPMAHARHLHSATLLPSGKVLVTGGYAGSNPVTSAEIFDPETNTWFPAGDVDRRSYPSVTLLSSGSVLIAGGTLPNDHLNVTLVDVTDASFSSTGELAGARSAHSQTPLPNGPVLAAGGTNGFGTLATTERFDSASGSWTSASPMSGPRRRHSATLLPSGLVLVAGGFGDLDDSNVLPSVELYQPATDSWTSTGWLIDAVGAHSATLLASGKVLIAGGQGHPGPSPYAQVYDPDSGQWSGGGQMAHARRDHTATLLPSGKVLVVGGFDGTSAVTEAELFDPETNSWSSAGFTNESYAEHSATLLSNGTVLVAGGSATTAGAEVFDPTTGSWTPTPGMLDRHWNHTATLLPSGKVLVAGGEGSTGSSQTAELYDPYSNSFTVTEYLGTARRGHAATLLPSGRVLLAGGMSNTGILVECEQFDEGRGFDDARRPNLTSIDPVLRRNAGFRAIGTGFRAISQASCGSGYSYSLADVPVVVLRSLDSGQTRVVPLDDSLGWSDTSFAGVCPELFPLGHAFATVVTNGIPSFSSVVRIQATTSVSLAVSTTTPSVGQSVTFTAQVSPRTASGWVKFFDGSTTIGTQALSAGSALLQTSSLAQGTHSITAEYSGDLPSATSSPVVVEVAPPAIVQFDAVARSVAEGSHVKLTLVRSGRTSGKTVVYFKTFANTANAPADYASGSGYVTFDDGETYKDISIQTTQDAEAEGGETFLVRIQPQAGSDTQIGSFGSCIVTIDDDDQAGTFAYSGSSYTVDEGKLVTVTITRTGGTGIATVDWNIDANTATTTDFSPKNGTLTFGQGETSRSFVVTALQDTAIEDVESAFLSLSLVTPGSALGANRAAALTIRDDEPAAAGFSLTSVVTSLPELGVLIAVTVTRPTATTDQSVTIATSNGTATAGSDYVAVPSTKLTFKIGETTKYIGIAAIADDAAPVAEGTEFFNVFLSNPSGGAKLGHDRQAIAVISDDDVAGTVEFSSGTFSVDEATGSAIITLVRDGGADGPISVAFSTTGVSASAPGDFTAITNGLVKFASGQTTATIKIPIVDDANHEGAEVLNVTLSNPTGGSALDTRFQTVLVILDDDAMKTRSSVVGCRYNE
jgi:hypothetical protein